MDDGGEAVPAVGPQAETTPMTWVVTEHGDEDLDSGTITVYTGGVNDKAILPKAPRLVREDGTEI